MHTRTASRSPNGDRGANVARSVQVVACATALHELVDVEAARYPLLGVSASLWADVQAFHLAAVLGLF